MKSKKNNQGIIIGLMILLMVLSSITDAFIPLSKVQAATKNSSLAKRSESLDVTIYENDASYEGGDKHLYAVYNAYQSYDKVTLNLSKVQKVYSKYGYKNKGIYAAFYSPVKATIEAFDKSGKRVGKVTKKGNFYAEFPKATKLVITNVKDNLAIYFFPTAPTMITGAGTYTYEDFTWKELPKGTKRAYYLYAYKNSFGNFNSVYNRQASLSMHSIADYSGIPQGISDFWSCGYFSLDSKDADKIDDFRLIAGKSYIYKEDKELLLFGKEGLDLSDNYLKDVKNMIKAMKKVGKLGYVKDTKALAKRVNISIFDTHPSSSYPDVYLNDTIIDTSDLGNLQTHLHEMAHYYDTINNHYGLLVRTWVEGFAETYSEDALKEMGKIDSNYLYADYDFADYKNSGTKFEQYFLSLDNLNNDEYPVGYHFIRYIQSKYGSDVVAKINAKIISTIDRPMDIYQDDYNNKKFIECITSCTSMQVFSNFEKEVINKK